MPFTVNSTLQRASSQFTHLKTILPSTTASGVAPGQALLDTPSPSHPPSPPLERSQPTQKPSSRVVEASQSDPSTLKTKGKRADKTQTNKRNGKNFGKTSNAGTTKSTTKSRLWVENTGMASKSGDDADQEEDHNGDNSDGEKSDSNDSGSNSKEEETQLDQTIIDQLEALLGHSVMHLSNKQIKLLLSGIGKTQVSALGTQAEQAPTITKLHARVGLASSDCSISLSHKGLSSQQISQKENSSTTNNFLVPQKRNLNALIASTTSKCVRIAGEQSDSATEDESDSDSNTHRRRPSASSSDFNSEREDPPCPTAHFQKLPTPVTSRQRPLPGHMCSNPTPSTQLCTLSARLPSLMPPNLNSMHTAPKHSFNTVSYPPSHLPPTDLSNTNALAAWAIQIAHERVHVLGQDASNLSGPRRSQQSGTGQLPPRNTSSTQVNASHPASDASTGFDDGLATDTNNLGESPKKRRRKAKLSDFPGRLGKVASVAIPRFLATVFAEGAYKTLETFQDWALDAYCRTWELEFPEYTYKPLPKVLIMIMTRRVSWLRGEVKKKVHEIVQFGYGFDKSVKTPAIIKANKRLAKRLHANAFHCRDLVADKNHFEAPQFIAGIGAGLCSDPEALGVVFLKQFEVVLIPAVAFILTMMQACIDKWRLGTWNRHDLDADTQQVEYEQHLLSLYVYEQAALDRLTRYRKEWAKAGPKSSGAILEDDPKAAKPYIDVNQV